MPETENTQQPGLLDRVIARVSPKWAAHRAYYRQAIDAIPDFQAVYRGAIPTRVDTPWNTTIGYQGANHPLNRFRLTKLRDRARDLERNNAIAAGMLDRCVENVISHGMRLQAQTDDDDFNEQAEELWDDWTQYADIRGRSWTDFQRLTFRSHMRDGDVGVALVQRGGDVKLQPIEGDQIDTLSGGYSIGDNVLDGIKFNKDGRPLAFHIVGVDVNGTRDETVVSANDFIFYPRLRFLSQVRGEPCYAQCFRLFDMLDGYIEASVIGARVAVCHALLIKKLDAGKLLGNLKTDTNSIGEQQRITNTEPGMVHYLNPGEDVVQTQPNQPTQSFPEFVSQLLRIAGVTLGLPLELVLLDFSRTNYSSARASLLQAYRSFKTMQKGYIDTVLSRIYRWRISKWVKDGTLKVPRSLQGGQGTNPSFWKHNFLAAGWSWVDPTKEIQAALLEVDAGLNTLTNIAHQHGYEWNEMIKKRSAEIKEMHDLEVPISRSTLSRDEAPPMVPGAALPGEAVAATTKTPANVPQSPDDDDSQDESNAPDSN